MLGKWSSTGNEYCQYIRGEGSIFEMIEAVWLDTTDEDRAKGYHEWCVVEGSIDLKDYTDEEIDGYLSSYDTTLEKVRSEWKESGSWYIAECILEEEIVRDCCVIADADSIEEARSFIMDYISKHGGVGA